MGEINRKKGGKNMLVVIAEKEELEIVKEAGYEGVPVLITGVGGMNVINTMKDISRKEIIVNIGYCGSNSIEIGKLVHVRNVRTYHPNAEFDERSQLQFISTLGEYDCYTATDFVTHTDIKEPCVFDMELAFIKALGFERIISIKKVSDNLKKKEYKKTIGENKNDRKS